MSFYNKSNLANPYTFTATTQNNPNHNQNQNGNSPTTMEQSIELFWQALGTAPVPAAAVTVTVNNTTAPLLAPLPLPQVDAPQPKIDYATELGNSIKNNNIYNYCYQLKHTNAALVAHMLCDFVLDNNNTQYLKTANNMNDLLVLRIVERGPTVFWLLCADTQINVITTLINNTRNINIDTLFAFAIIGRSYDLNRGINSLWILLNSAAEHQADNCLVCALLNKITKILTKHILSSHPDFTSCTDKQHSHNQFKGPNTLWVCINKLHFPIIKAIIDLVTTGKFSKEDLINLLIDVPNNIERQTPRTHLAKTVRTKLKKISIKENNVNICALLLLATTDGGLEIIKMLKQRNIINAQAVIYLNSYNAICKRTEGGASKIPAVTTDNYNKGLRQTLLANTTKTAAAASCSSSSALPIANIPTPASSMSQTPPLLLPLPLAMPQTAATTFPSHNNSNVPNTNPSRVEDNSQERQKPQDNNEVYDNAPTTILRSSNASRDDTDLDVAMRETHKRKRNEYVDEPTVSTNFSVDEPTVSVNFSNASAMTELDEHIINAEKDEHDDSISHKKRRYRDDDLNTSTANGSDNKRLFSSSSTTQPTFTLPSLANANFSFFPNATTSPANKDKLDTQNKSYHR